MNNQQNLIQQNKMKIQELIEPEPGAGFDLNYNDTFNYVKVTDYLTNSIQEFLTEKSLVNTLNVFKVFKNYN